MDLKKVFKKILRHALCCDYSNASVVKGELSQGNNLNMSPYLQIDYYNLFVVISTRGYIILKSKHLISHFERIQFTVWIQYLVSKPPSSSTFTCVSAFKKTIHIRQLNLPPYCLARQTSTDQKKTIKKKCVQIKTEHSTLR